MKILLLFFPILCLSWAQNCPDGWHYAAETNKCYQLVCDPKYEEFKNARKYCKEQGGDLASILSEAENKAISAYMAKSHPSTHGNGIRIGLIFLNGKWGWTDGYLMNYTNWDKNEGQPLQKDVDKCKPFCFAKGSIELDKGKPIQTFKSSFDCPKCHCNLCKRDSLGFCPGKKYRNDFTLDDIKKAMYNETWKIDGYKDPLLKAAHELLNKHTAKDGKSRDRKAICDAIRDLNKPKENVRGGIPCSWKCVLGDKYNLNYGYMWDSNTAYFDLKGDDDRLVVWC